MSKQDDGGARARQTLQENFSHQRVATAAVKTAKAAKAPKRAVEPTQTEKTTNLVAQIRTQRAKKSKWQTR